MLERLSCRLREMLLITLCLAAPVVAGATTSIAIGTRPDIQLRTEIRGLEVLYGFSLLARASTGGVDETVVSIAPEAGLRLPVRRGADWSTFLLGAVSKRIPIVVSSYDKDLVRDQNDEWRFRIGSGLVRRIGGGLSLEGEVGLASAYLRYRFPMYTVDPISGQLVKTHKPIEAVTFNSYCAVGIAIKI